MGAIGFCWGAYYALKASASGKFKAVVGPHPSLQIGGMYVSTLGTL